MPKHSSMGILISGEEEEFSEEEVFFEFWKVFLKNINNNIFCDEDMAFLGTCDI